MIQVNSLSKSFGGQTLFENISFNLGSKERLGIVGRNGCGKSTLFRLILGEMEADQGDIAIPKNYKIGYLEQHIHFTQKTILKEACLGLPIEDEFNHYKAEKILFGLGFSAEDMERDPNLCSGGQQIRINLAKTLVSEPQLLLLDEPTNYLDLLAIRWLTGFLKSFDGEIILITHDRGFMDSVTTHTLGIYRQKIKKVRGTTDKLYDQIAQEDEIHQKTLLNQQKKRQEMEDFVRRFKAKATKATQAQSRVKMLEKMEMLDEIASEQSLHLTFNYKDFSAKQVGEIKNLSFSYPGKEELISNFSFFINKEDRIAIIGKNGKGKSTLLNLIASELTPTGGEVKLHSGVSIGHFGQTNIDRLHQENSIIQEISEMNSDLGIAKVRAICGAMLFTNDLAEKKIKVLSGGERARVMFGKILAKEVNLLLLDEPTNHLDMQSIEILSMQLEQFDGATIFVSHSELLLRQVATKLIIFQHDKVELFNGGYDEFLEKVGWAEDKVGISGKSLEVCSSHSAEIKMSYKEKKQRRAELVKERNQKLKPLKRKFEECEKNIEQNEESLDQLQEELLICSERQEGKKVAELTMEIGQTQNLVDKLMDEYEELGLEIESIESEYQNSISLYD